MPEVAALRDILPKDKFDTDGAEALVALGHPAVEPILPELLAWLQDMNWPVARVIQPFLAQIGAPLAPHLRAALASQDHVWKYWILTQILAESPELRALLREDLERLAWSPIPGERDEELDIEAGALLTRPCEVDPKNWTTR